VRGAARDGLVGDSPVSDLRDSIALEIAAERMGCQVFANGAAPSMVFKFADGFQGYKTDEERTNFLDEIQSIYAGKGRFRSILLPRGVEHSEKFEIDNEKAQTLELRQYQRTVIAGAFGVPPHMVGDLSNGTFQNVEQQSLDFVTNVVLPYVRMFEAALEAALLTDAERADGLVIRFNLDAALRADFKTRQEGLQIQRQNGVINANDWAEKEGMNPISAEDGGEEYWRQGPSGQSADAGGADPQDQPEDQPADPANPKQRGLYVAA